MTFSGQGDRSASRSQRQSVPTWFPRPCNDDSEGTQIVLVCREADGGTRTPDPFITSQVEQVARTPILPANRRDRDVAAGGLTVCCLAPGVPTTFPRERGKR